MPSCSNSSNINSSINTLNVTQGSGGSRLLTSISVSEAPGITIGNVIRYDVASSGYTASKADTLPNSEVFGIVESYSSATNRFSVVLHGSISIDESNLATIPEFPTGGSGGNDIYFLSGSTAGLLQNVAPSATSNVIKPIYQRAPHGVFSGSVVNYIGYKLGGNAQAALDTNTLFAQVGSVQFVFDNAAYSDFFSEEETKLKQYGLNYTGTPRPAPYFAQPATTPIDWNLEHLRIDNDFTLLREIDFPEFSVRIMPMFNGGWVERIRINENQVVDNTFIGRTVRQLSHSQYSDSTVSTSCYGQIIDWDVDNRYLYIRRPAYRSSNLNNTRSTLLFETSALLPSSGQITIFPNADFTGIPVTRTITTTDVSIQFFGYITSKMMWSSTLPGSSPFEFDSIFDPFNLDIPGSINQFSRLYMKIKNKGISLSVPDNLTMKNITAQAITLTTPNPDYDINTKIEQLIDRMNRNNLIP